MKSIFLLSALSYLTSASISLTSLDAPHISSRHANLKAAGRHRDLLARGDNFILDQTVELAYAEYHMNGPIISSHVLLEAGRPTLLLEEFYHHFQEVNCHDSKLKVVLSNKGSYSRAKEELGSILGGILIASHQSCGDGGAHTIFR